MALTMSDLDDQEKKARILGDLLLQRGEMLVTAESCTGGGISQILTEIPGSSVWFERGFVTYSNLAKTEMLGVSEEKISSFGAVSESVVKAMTEGALNHSPADWAVAVSGIAGPSGGTPEKPVGTIWMAWQVRGKPSEAESHVFGGNRAAIRRQTINRALQGLIDRLGRLDS
jgi:nicotinamide-nucleotide amidase